MESERVVSLVLSGNPGVGKTSLQHKYVNGGAFPASGVNDSSIGLSFITRKAVIGGREETPVQVWDYRGSLRRVPPVLYRKTDALLVVFDLSAPPDSVTPQLDHWLHDFLVSPYFSTSRLFVVGNKRDLVDATPPAITAWCRSHPDISYFEV
eukprot:TRINITY_DN27383_c0_g1_i1.p2 TRINITY_DN27383_c0_g1~~TRINITY_DN27383_c0_g1_i1.p2  ORF type:complete len:152 (+),score=33.28 TRINITY_DN27383_c0_g1_i1:24-479(+)